MSNNQNLKQKGEARIRIEEYLNRHRTPVTVPTIMAQTGLTREQVTNTLNSMRKVGQLIITGMKPHTLYSLAGVKGPEPKYLRDQVQAPWTEPAKQAWSPPAKKPAPEIEYPAGYKRTMGPGPSTSGDHYQGANWTASTMRPGCLDHEDILSRRGDGYVAHRPPISMQHGGFVEK